jgi:hypothetical protein
LLGSPLALAKLMNPIPYWAHSIPLELFAGNRKGIKTSSSYRIAHWRERLLS